MRFFRFMIVIGTQLPLLLFFGGMHDLLFGFNQTDEGFLTLIGLGVLMPILNLAWLILESRRTCRLAKTKGFNKSLLFPFVALFFLLESLAIALYLLGQLRM